MIDAFLSMHWAWYIPMYFIAGIVLTALFLVLLPEDSDLYDEIVEEDFVPPQVLVLLWPFFILVLLGHLVWHSLDAIFEKATRFDPQNLNPQHYLRSRRKAKNKTEAELVDEAVPSWARWH